MIKKNTLNSLLHLLLIECSNNRDRSSCNSANNSPRKQVKGGSSEESKFNSR